MKRTWKQPASRWGEALPLGNGHMGAMVYGGYEVEQIDLSENTFYSGSGSEHNNQPGAAKTFEKMRQEARAGKFDQVHETAKDYIGVRENYGTNLPVGQLYIKYPKGEKINEYERSLDLNLGKCQVIRQSDANTILEEIRISHPDQVLMINIQSEQPIDVEISFVADRQEGGSNSLKEGFLFYADAFETMHCDEKTGVHLEGACTVQSDGQVDSLEQNLKVSAATYVNLYLTMETDFASQEDRETLSAKTLSRSVAAAKKGKEKIVADHEEDMKQLTAGTLLELTGEDPVTQQIPFLFQYARYLLFSASREDSKLPAHLQGIWNDNVACRIGWTCDMHLDINTQMNYWPSEMTGLTHCNAPLFRWIKEDLAPKGRQTARESYGLEGWVAELVSNAWGFAAPYWASPLAPCPTGGVWILSHMWEHYLYTKDQDFLRKEAFPLIEDASRFFQKYVFQLDSGMYGCGPSISPENSFLYEGEPYQISNNCTYEILMIRQLFDSYLKAVEILQIPREEQLADIQTIYEKLLPYRILEDGRLAEWDHHLQEADPQHRHTSHLLGLYPFDQITPEETPELCQATEKTIQARLHPIENWEDTGWARSMLMLYEARLGHGEQAFEHICSMVNELLEPNGMVYHPPTRGAMAFDHVYELDGNTGLCSCICEMLVQSHKDRIKLLPALPAAWAAGKLERFHARGGIEISMEWENGKLKKAEFFGKEPCKVQVVYGDQTQEIFVQPGGTIIHYPQ